MQGENDQFGETEASLASSTNNMLKLYPLQVLGHSLCKYEYMSKVERHDGKDKIPPRQVITLNEMRNIREELDCPLCFNLLYEPTALSCGHVLCKPCLARTLDHALTKLPSCPLCRDDLSNYARTLNNFAKRANVRDRQSKDSKELKNYHGASYISVCTALHTLVERHFPDDYTQRAEDVKEEEATAAGKQDKSGTDLGSGEEIPIFICNIAFPGVKNPLHVFEPRYRLMMRRCVESGNQFSG